MEEQQSEIVRDLRELIHAVIVNVGSGRLGFDYALKEYVENSDTSLAHAFRVYIPAMGLGSETSREVPVEKEPQTQTLRRDALRQIAQSIGEPKVTRFVEALIRSQDEHISLVSTLTEFEERLNN